MGILYANVGGTWVPIESGGSGGTGTDEVWIGPGRPATGELDEIELWYDSDEATTAAPAGGLDANKPRGGAACSPGSVTSLPTRCAHSVVRRQPVGS